VGAASGTVAQTICAYDKAFSDERYGRGTRYVSRERLLSMLEREYQTLEQQLRGARGAEVRFFAFADTIAARNFKGDNEQHGWVGLRFQATSGAAPSDILLHVALRDRTVEMQRNALGVLGVNLVHAAFHQKAEARPFLAVVFEGLSIERLEIDVVELSGPFFEGQDARLWCLEALRSGMALALLFDHTGRPEQPSTLLRKRTLVVEGQASAERLVEARTLVSAAFARLHQEEKAGQEPMLLLDARLEQLDSPAGPGSLAERLGLLTARGPVIVTAQRELHPVVEYLRRHTSAPCAWSPTSRPSLDCCPEATRPCRGRCWRAWESCWWRTSGSTSIQSPGDLSAMREARVSASPSGAEVTLDDLRCEPPLDHLLRYLRGADWLVPLELPERRRRSSDGRG
jgi:hypothetical protein